MGKILTRLTVAPAAVVAAGALALAGASPAGASLAGASLAGASSAGASSAGVSPAGATPAGATIDTTNQAGYQVGGPGHWSFRYIRAEFTVPQHACSSDDFSRAGIQLAGKVDSVAVGVACRGSLPTAGYQFGYDGTTWSNTWTFTTKTLSDDLILASLYYDQGNNYVSMQETDLTTGQTLVNDTSLAYGAMYHWATALAQVNTPLIYAPDPGQSFVLVPFSDVAVTSYDGTHGQDGGMTGLWAVTALRAVNGAHVDFAARPLYSSGSGRDNTFNTREYGNS
jgi:hypothetical protein